MTVIHRNMLFFLLEVRKLKTLLILSICLQIGFFLFSALLGDSAFILCTTLPISSPFIHASVGHFVQNFVMLGVLIIPTVNRRYTAKQLVYLAIVLALAYMPFVLLGFSVPVIGLSGLGYFLLARFVFSNQYLRKLVITCFALLIIGEISLLGSSDDIAHGFHLFSAGFGLAPLFVSRPNFRSFYRRD